MTIPMTHVVSAWLENPPENTPWLSMFSSTPRCTACLVRKALYQLQQLPFLLSSNPPREMGAKMVEEDNK